ncbi:DUF6082 family protein [Actinoplanes sp. NPDC049265]|uniref:DUF6082 family protein n=1 Tax=Actinoplanes sp. NPDC049265 TaxID=3363902 RepID=UPI003716DF74
MAFPIFTQDLVKDRDWKSLSDIGQAYGGISAVVAGLGFCGIAASLALQVRQTRLTQAISARERHFELVKVGLENPTLSYQFREENPELYKKKVLINLWVSHWLLLWDIGEADEEFVRLALDDLFQDRVACEWWREWGANFATPNTRRHRKFMEIVGHRHTMAEAENADTTEDSGASCDPRQQP